MGRKIFFWFMRHGQKPSETTDDITEFGERQVAASVEAHLLDAGTFQIYRSNTVRTQKSMSIACKILHIDGNVMVDPLVDIRPPDLANLPSFSFPQFERDLQERYGNALTAWHWFERFPPAWLFRARLQQFLEVKCLDAHYALEHFLIGSHSPFAELAVPNPHEARGLGYADIIRYTVEQSWRPYEARIVAVDYFDCPLQRE